MSASYDKSLALWDLETGAILRRFEEHMERVSGVCPDGKACSLAVLPDGLRALCGYDDAMLRLWDIETGSELRCFQGHEGGVWSISIFAGSRKAVSGSHDTTLRLWDIDTGCELLRFDGHEGRVNAVDVLPSGACALSGSNDRTVRLWDLETGKELRRFEGHKDEVLSLAVLPDGRRALSGSRDHTLRLWDIERNDCLATFTGDAAITAISCVDETLIVSGSRNGAMHILELRNHERTTSCPAPGCASAPSER